MRRDEIEVGKTYAKEGERPGRRYALDRTVIAISTPVPPAPNDAIVTYESDAVIGRKTCTLAAFAAWARRAL